MARSNKLPFKDTLWYKPLFWLVMVLCVLACIWLLESGALAIWDRHSPENMGPQLPLPWAMTLGMPSGLFIGFIVMLQLEISYERWRNKDEVKGTTMTDDLDFDIEVIEAIQAGRKIDAIKQLRTSRNIGLKEAKELVDQYCQENQIEMPGSAGGSLAGFLIFLFVVGVTVLVFNFGT